MPGWHKGMTRLKHQERMEKIARWMARGHSTLAIIQKAQGEWNVARRTIYNYIRRVRDLDQKGNALSGATAYCSRAFRHYRDIISDDSNPLEMRLKAQAQMDRLAEKFFGLATVVESKGELRVEANQTTSLVILSESIRADPEALSLLLQLDNRLAHGNGKNGNGNGNGVGLGHPGSGSPLDALGALLSGPSGSNGNGRKISDAETHRPPESDPD